MNRNVIVFGATGKTGIAICRELKEKKIPYSVFVRKKSSSKILHSSIRIKKGDVLNTEDVEGVFQNEVFTDVIIALGSKDLKSDSIRSKGTKHILEALTKNKSNSFIHVISALGIGESWNQLKWHGKLISKLLIKSTMNDHTEQEKLVRNSSNPYHILRPVALKDGEATGEIHVQNEGFLPSNSIKRADVAKFLVESLLENKEGINGICQKSK